MVLFGLELPERNGCYQQIRGKNIQKCHVRDSTEGIYKSYIKQMVVSLRLKVLAKSDSNLYSLSWRAAAFISFRRQWKRQRRALAFAVILFGLQQQHRLAIDRKLSRRAFSCKRQESSRMWLDRSSFQLFTFEYFNDRTIFRKESNIFCFNASFQGELPEFLHQVGAGVRAASCQTPGRKSMTGFYRKHLQTYRCRRQKQLATLMLSDDSVCGEPPQTWEKLALSIDASIALHCCLFSDPWCLKTLLLFQIYQVSTKQWASAGLLFFNRVLNTGLIGKLSGLFSKNPCRLCSNPPKQFAVSSAQTAPRRMWTATTYCITCWQHWRRPPSSWWRAPGCARRTWRPLWSCCCRCLSLVG